MDSEFNTDGYTLVDGVKNTSEYFPKNWVIHVPSLVGFYLRSINSLNTRSLFNVQAKHTHVVRENSCRGMKALEGRSDLCLGIAH